MPPRPLPDGPRWAAALAEHERALRAFLAAAAELRADDWARAPAPGAWSPAAVVLHVCRTYELGRDAAAGGPGMRLLLPRSVAWLSRTLLLPVLLASGRFPRGLPAPCEIVPDVAEARRMTPDAAAARLTRAAGEAAAALHQAAAQRPTPRVAHAAFGPLEPRAALRLLSAHTRHHARELRRLASQAPAG